jgi:hypothetical protein
MTKPNNTILTEDGVITEEALLAYAEGRLGNAEMAEMDKLLSGDPFAQEALEGMRTSPKPGDIHTAITSINTKLREKAGIRERNKKGIEIHWANYAYAALVLGVLVGVAFVMIQIFSGNRKEKMAQATESVAVPMEKKKDETKSDTTKLIAADAQKDSISTMNFTSTPTATGGAAANTDNTVTGTIQSKDQDEQRASAEKSSVGPPSTPSSGVSQTTSSVSGDLAARLAVARTFFDANNYANAETKYNEILASQPDNAEALYFGGVCNFINGSKGLGEANFDKLMRGGIYMDGAKWYKALILIKDGKKDQAKPILKDLSITGGYFKDRAVKEYGAIYGF